VADERRCVRRYTAGDPDAGLFERRPIVHHTGESGDIHHVARFQPRRVSASDVDAAGGVLNEETGIAQHRGYRAPHVHAVRGSAFVAESLQALDGPYGCLERLTRRGLQNLDVGECCDVQQWAQNLVLAIENRSRDSLESYAGFHQFGGNMIIAAWREQRQGSSAIHGQFQAQVSVIRIRGNGADNGFHFHPRAIHGRRGQFLIGWDGRLSAWDFRRSPASAAERCQGRNRLARLHLPAQSIVLFSALAFLRPMHPDAAAGILEEHIRTDRVEIGDYAAQPDREIPGELQQP
jgi:hypothetical protein